MFIPVVFKACQIACTQIMFIYFTEDFVPDTYYMVCIIKRLTIRGFTNPKKLFLKDDTSLYLVEMKNLLAVKHIQGSFSEWSPNVTTE